MAAVDKVEIGTKHLSGKLLGWLLRTGSCYSHVIAKAVFTVQKTGIVSLKYLFDWLTVQCSWSEW